MATETGKPRGNLHDRLILAGMKELNEHGVSEFSVRRIAAACGVSCAAPYKHFTDKQEFIGEIIDYINAQWHARQEAVLARNPESTRRLLVEISMEYIEFLLENPQFRSIIMFKNEEALSRKSDAIRGGVSALTEHYITQYCREVGMPDPDRVRKTFSVRSLIYGAALMLDNGELPRTDENMEMVAEAINREFDLP